jgi:hypothetical protein
MRTYKIFADASIEADNIDEALEKLARYFLSRADKGQTPSPLGGTFIICPPENLRPNRDADGNLVEGEAYMDGWD